MLAQMVASLAWTDRPDASLPVAIEVLRHGPISRADLARRMGMSAGSLSRLTAPLIDQGLLVDIGEHNDGRVGRPTRLLDVTPESRHFVGIKLRETEVVGALTDLRGGVLNQLTLPLSGRRPDDVVGTLVDLIDTVRDGITIAGVGIGLGGRVRKRTHVMSARFLGWTDVPLAALVAERTGFPTRVDNDVIAFTEYERWFGAGRDDDRFAVVTLGIGTGFGLVANGALIVDEDHGLGLVGHWPLDPSGPLCEEGHRGCAASLLNSDSIARRASIAIGEELTFDEVLDAAENGQRAAGQIVREAGRGLGVLIAAISNLTLPQRIIIGGEGVRLAVLAQSEMRRSLSDHRNPLAAILPVIFTDGDNAEWCRGAAALAIQSFVLGSADESKLSGRDRLRIA
ncbi:ROK family transcriptional regulator [Agromyces albus]|uniref:ROK family transcriptional regulator n=1 Tax=Agromyces albus TaxID=205332 RepID=UPI00278AA279|nr:ROK family transcriptional regulator [Agromyces albus]MDQ0573843.1 putative NBD/HSP70 family sugar kinase [Agromyces albus]